MLNLHFWKLVILEYLSVLTIRDLRVFPMNSSKINLFRLSIVHFKTTNYVKNSYFTQLWTGNKSSCLFQVADIIPSFRSIIIHKIYFTKLVFLCERWKISSETRSNGAVWKHVVIFIGVACTLLNPVKSIPLSSTVCSGGCVTIHE